MMEESLYLLNIAYSASQPWLTDVVSQSRPLRCRRIRSEAVVEFIIFLRPQVLSSRKVGKKGPFLSFVTKKCVKLANFLIFLQGVLMSPGS